MRAQYPLLMAPALDPPAHAAGIGVWNWTEQPPVLPTPVPPSVPWSTPKRPQELTLGVASVNVVRGPAYKAALEQQPNALSAGVA